MRRFTRTYRWLALLWLAGSDFPAVAASFDCGKASTVQEKAICADSKLSKLDEDVAAAYAGLRAQLTPAGAAQVQQDQRGWLVWLRQDCPDRYDQGRMRSCLMQAYAARLYPLEKGLKRVGGMTFFPRLKVVTAPDEEKPQPNTSDPGFGVGWFSWPEIDKPTPRQAAWNAAVRKQAIRMTADTDGRQPPADFEASSVAGSDVTIVYRLRAANERFISVDLEKGFYNYGAAHPNEYTISFPWWAELGRALKAEDVFRAGSGWEAYLERRCYQKLTAGEHAQDLYDDQIVRHAVADAVKEVQGWTLDARKFKLVFAEYTVAPRVAGLVDVELGWEELKPYLASAFDPARLPEPIGSQAQ